MSFRMFSSVEEQYKEEIDEINKDSERRKEIRNGIVGVVTSTKNMKTITVTAKRDKYFPKYNSYLCRTKKTMAHDEEEQAKLGDLVRIVPCARKSPRKAHRLYEIIKRYPPYMEGAPKLDSLAEEKAKKAKYKLIKNKVNEFYKGK